MLIVMDSAHTPSQLEAVRQKIEAMGFKSHIIPGEHSVAVGVTGNSGALDPRDYEVMPGVRQAIRVTKPYKLAGRDFKHGDTVVKVGDVRLGDPKRFIVIAGPCAVESEDQTVRIAKKVKAAGAHMLRGGAFKPRTSPYAFQGLGMEGLKYLAEAKKVTGLPIISELMDPRDTEVVCEYVDIIQIGARNMQNFRLLSEVGKSRKPILLKRGLSATIKEFLMSAEYIAAEGNSNIILCERGIRTFETATRNTLDLSAIPVLKEETHLPVFVDPSHAVGIWSLVAPLSMAAVAVGADGLMIEVHTDPENALCDGAQSLKPSKFAALMVDARKVALSIGRSI